MPRRDPAWELLRAQLRAGQRGAIARISAALRRHGGSVRAAAAEFGLGKSTLYRAIVEVPELQAELAALGTPTEKTLRNRRPRGASKKS